MWNFIVRFAKAHSASLPTSLPKYLASQDAWFHFTLVAHVFAYPLNQVFKNYKTIIISYLLNLFLNFFKGIRMCAEL